VRLPPRYVNDEVISAETIEKLKKFKSAEQKQSVTAGFSRIQLPDARVLVVDDLEINLEVARGMIEPYGIKVDCVLSGAEAVAHVRWGTKYNAILMNRLMPEMDGIEAVRLIRNEIGTEYARNVPVIALTANAVTGNNAFFLKVGFQDVLSKPIGIMKLDEVIRRWVAGEKA
jgi:CheY-like chemotaxis protein